MKKVLVMLMATLMALSACMPKSPGSEAGPYHKWFNPYGQEVQDVIPEQTCQTMPVPDDPPPPPPPLEGAEAGWRYATYTMLVDGIRLMHQLPLSPSDFEYCLPVSLYVYVTASGVPGAVVEIHKGGAQKWTTPWNALRYTPWRATIVVKWDPRTTPPVMNFELIAKVERGEGLAQLPAPTDATVALMCRIRQDVNTLSLTMSTDVFAPSAKLNVHPDAMGEYWHGPVVNCRPPAFSARPQ